MAVYWILLNWCVCSVESDDCSPGRARLGGARAEPGSGDPSLDPRRLDPCLQPCRGRCRGLDRLRGALQITSAGLRGSQRMHAAAPPWSRGQPALDPLSPVRFETRSRRLGDPVTAFGRPGHGVWAARLERTRSGWNPAARPTILSVSAECRAFVSCVLAGRRTDAAPPSRGQHSPVRISFRVRRPVPPAVRIESRAGAAAAAVALLRWPW